MSQKHHLAKLVKTPQILETLVVVKEAVGTCIVFLSLLYAFNIARMLIHMSPAPAVSWMLLCSFREKRQEENWNPCKKVLRTK